MARAFRDGDEGNTVMTADGDMVGTVEKISGTEAHVKPDAGLSQSIRQRLGWTTEGEDVYALKHDHVDKISGSEIHLKSDF